MDTLQEESRSDVEAAADHQESQHLLCPPKIYVRDIDFPHRCHDEQQHSSNHELPGSSSRRPSVVLATLRRTSQTNVLSAVQAIMRSQNYFLSLFQGERSISGDGTVETEKEEKVQKCNRKLGEAALTTILSALYAKLLVVLGMAFPITEIISPNVRPFFYQGFYLYLYLGSICFVAYMYATLMKENSGFWTLNVQSKDEKPAKNNSEFDYQRHPVRYGSFYLRLGAIAFGIGSMVHSGLEFGRYFELKNNSECYSNVLQAITPATRMLLTLVQVQFIFLNDKHLEMGRHKIISKFGLMHMIAANVCEWLYVLVEETKHEIIHLSENHSSNSSNFTSHEERNVMSSLVTNVSPFLFPCTIEYSLICAVILFEMWKHVETVKKKSKSSRSKKSVRKSNADETQQQVMHFDPPGNHRVQSHHHFTVDCSNAHRGLFAGILVIVSTIISLIMFFVLSKVRGSREEIISYKIAAEFEVNVVEIALYTVTSICLIIAMIQMRDLKYDRKVSDGIGLDNTLLVLAQTGVFIYCMFSIIGCHFTLSVRSPAGLLAEIFSFVQTCLQTMFVLDGWWRRCRNVEQAKKKPGRELITFLIIANMAMWTINALEKNRAEFRPTHLSFFGAWAWTIITHISMPLAIFYRFHSTICLFEIWKTAYKIKTHHKLQMLQRM